MKRQNIYMLVCAVSLLFSCAKSDIDLVQEERDFFAIDFPYTHTVSTYEPIRHVINREIVPTDSSLSVKNTYFGGEYSGDYRYSLGSLGHTHIDKAIGPNDENRIYMHIDIQAYIFEKTEEFNVYVGPNTGYFVLQEVELNIEKKTVYSFKGVMNHEDTFTLEYIHGACGRFNNTYFKVNLTNCSSITDSRINLKIRGYIDVSQMSSEQKYPYATVQLNTYETRKPFVKWTSSSRGSHDGFAGPEPVMISR